MFGWITAALAYNERQAHLTQSEGLVRDAIGQVLNARAAASLTRPLLVILELDDTPFRPLNQQFQRYEDLFLERPNYAVMETADYLPQFVGKPPNFAPGESCRYCNVGYVLLGLMIERATGSSLRSRTRSLSVMTCGLSCTLTARRSRPSKLRLDSSFPVLSMVASTGTLP